MEQVLIRGRLMAGRPSCRLAHHESRERGGPLDSHAARNQLLKRRRAPRQVMHVQLIEVQRDLRFQLRRQLGRASRRPSGRTVPCRKIL